MSFQIKEMDSLSGTKAHIYSVLFDGDDDTLIEQFFNENEGNEQVNDDIKVDVIINNKNSSKFVDGMQEKGRKQLSTVQAFKENDIKARKIKLLQVNHLKPQKKRKKKIWKLKIYQFLN